MRLPLGEWRGVLVLFGAIALSVGAHYAFLYRPLVDELRHTNKPKLDHFEDHPLIAPSLIRQLGWLVPSREGERARSFQRIAPEKRPGVGRVCCFGGSTTFGTEVEGGHGYPMRLQQLLDERARPEVEVINFGIPGYGFHQTFLLWEHLFERFGCDYTLLFPGSFVVARDASFVYSPLQEPYGMHARYVVQGGGVALIEVAGETKSERFEEYFRFVPRWRYLRYDREPPMALRALRPRDAPPRNPFYYLEASRKEEAQQTYRALLARMAEAGAPVVLGSSAKVDVASGDAVAAGNLSAVRIPRQRSFPYLAPRWHDGPLGNDLVARAFLLQILESADPRAPLLTTRDLPWPDAPGGGVAEGPLADYESVEVALAGTPIAHFTSADPRRVSSLAEAGVVSLLSIKQPGESIIESCFLPVDFALEEGMEASWSAERGPPPPAPGRLRRLGGANIGLLEIEGLRFRRQKRLLLDAPGPLPGNVTLELGGHAVLEGAREGAELAMKPTGAPCRRLRATADGWVDPEALDRAGVLDLVLRGDGGKVHRIPFARWERGTVALPVARKPLVERLKIPARDTGSDL